MEKPSLQPDQAMQDASDTGDVELSKDQELELEPNDEEEDEIDNSKLPWGKKRPIKPRMIEDFLIPFPTGAALAALTLWTGD
ncbi:hypothetical protein TWF694_010552 [Orbilia ellipsospora]|uniref:Uncharacterized protein n=1 Tax=Orbilia ellipsospora TaxID=2528407 RepID=A0AAV9XA82_9PEZI